MFQGFNIALPEYEVLTPHTGFSYNVRSMTVQEEERLKGSLVTGTKITDHLNKCLFECLVKKPEEIKDYDSWLKNTTLKDRDALLYGLYHITYEEIRNYEITCGSCDKAYSVTVKASETFNYNPYPDKDILTKTVNVPLQILKGVFVTIRQPTLIDESLAYKTILTQNTDMLIESLIIKSIIQSPDVGDSRVYSDRDDILDAYKTFPAKDKREVYRVYRETFGKYGINLLMKASCIHCDNTEEITLDLVQNFFRMVYSV
jgi:hypothetical protein